MSPPLGPLAWLASKDTEAFLDPAGQVRLRFGQLVRQEEKQRIRRVIERWVRQKAAGGSAFFLAVRINI